MKPNTLLLLSGGLDSTVLLHHSLDIGRKVHCLLFDYGQRHRQELDFARATCRELQVPFTQVELHRIEGLFLRCAITDGKGPIVVPNRNAVLLNIAAAMAAGMGVRTIVFGATKEDHANFPDCRREWLDSLNRTLKLTELGGVHVIAPYILKTKREIVRIGRNLGVDFTKTWSCYAGERKPCNKCDACKKRRKALCLGR